MRKKLCVCVVFKEMLMSMYKLEESVIVVFETATLGRKIISMLGSAYFWVRFLFGEGLDGLDLVCIFFHC